MIGTRASFVDGVRARLWPLPVAGVVCAMIAAVALPHLDRHVDAQLPDWTSTTLFGGDAGAARTLLDAISSSLITVTSLTFSLTVVTLQLASSQFSPRLLRTFTSDLFVQSTLAVFLATFTYALTLLRVVRSEDGGAPFVPRISVTVAFVLAMISVLGLVLFLAHLARQIRVETMMRDVHDDANATVDRSTDPRGRNAVDGTVALVPPSWAARLTSATSGFLTSIDGKRLLCAAVDDDVRLTIECHPGSSVVRGVPIGFTWQETGPLPPEAHERISRAVQASIEVGFERTAAQDVGYGLRQLTDVANKALSPGINDPTTAVHALGHISAILCRLAQRNLRPVHLFDADGRLRVVLNRPTFAEVLDDAITQPRRYGSTDPQVMARLFVLLEEVAWHAEDHHPVLDQLARVEGTVARADFDDAERRQLTDAGERVRTVVRQRASA